MSSIHSMCTRSKSSNDPPNDVDDQGNLQGLIDYSCNEEFNRDELNKELMRLSKGNIDPDALSKTNKRKPVKKIIIEELETASPKKSKYKIKKSGSKNDLGGILMTYILAKANENIRKKPKKKRTIII